MESLMSRWKEEYSRWLGSKIFEQKPELKEQADKLKTTLEQVKLIPPVDLKPLCMCGLVNTRTFH